MGGDGFNFMFFCTALGCWIVLATGHAGEGVHFILYHGFFRSFNYFNCSVGFSNLTSRLQLLVVQEKGLLLAMALVFGLSIGSTKPGSEVSRDARKSTDEHNSPWSGSNHDVLRHTCLFSLF